MSVTKSCRLYLQLTSIYLVILQISCHSQHDSKNYYDYKKSNIKINNSQGDDDDDDERGNFFQLLVDKFSYMVKGTSLDHPNHASSRDVNYNHGSKQMMYHHHRRRHRHGRLFDGLHKHHHHHHRMRPHQVLQRVFTFWSRAGPIIAHYQLTRAYFTIIKHKTYTREYRDVVYDKLHDRYAPKALDLILDMKGLFIKLGQVLSSRPDFVPHQYTDRFYLLQDYVPPWDVEEIKKIIEQSLYDYQHLDFTQVFDSLESIPLGSASIGQVHAATLNPNYYKQLQQQQQDTNNKNRYRGSTKVAIKVMHRDAEDQFRYDFKIFKSLCRVALPGWKHFVNELERQMMTEFDYRQESANLQRARNNLYHSPYRDKAVIPQPIDECSSPYVLVMEFLDGVKLVDAAEIQLAEVLLNGDRDMAKAIIRQKRKDIICGSLDEGKNSLYHTYGQIQNVLQNQSMLSRLRTIICLAALSRTQKSYLNLLLDVHGHQIFIDGCFNGDCHPGNVLLLKDGRLGLIDYGQFKVLSHKERLAACRIVRQIGISSVLDIDKETLKDAMNDVGFRFRYNKDNETIRRIASLFFDSDAEKSEFGFPSPQEYLLYLQSKEPIEHIPDSVVFIARTSFLFRGMSALLGEKVRTSHRWARFAEEALIDIM